MYNRLAAMALALLSLPLAWSHEGGGVCCIDMGECAEEIYSLYQAQYHARPPPPESSCLRSFIFPPFLASYSGGFTHISQGQMLKLRTLSEQPEWAEGDGEKVLQYYKFHEESQLDKNLGKIATTMGVILHGDLNQEQLADHLKQFDIRQLLNEGPCDNNFLSREAQKLIYEALHDIPRVYDIHLHNLGYDEGSYLNPKIASYELASWGDYFTFMVLRYAAGMRHPIGSTNEARKRLHLYAGSFPKFCGMILPIHGAILPGGKCDWDNTGSYLKCKSALLSAISFDNRDAELFPAVSCHPFDLAWEEKLTDAYEKGIRLIKWMPPQGIPPDSPLLDPFYSKVAQLKMTIIAHAGHQHALPSNEGNKIWEDCGNPLRFRTALQKGVDVILAHCGHEDLLPDLDHPDGERLPGYELFFRLAREAHKKNQSGEWKGHLYGDLAAVTTHYSPEMVKALLLQCNEPGVRLIYGSDYPYTNLIRPRHDAYDICSELQLIDAQKVAPLKEIRQWNPLLANYIFTKNLAWEGVSFPQSTFTGEFEGAPLKLIDTETWEIYKYYPSEG